MVNIQCRDQTVGLEGSKLIYQAQGMSLGDYSIWFKQDLELSLCDQLRVTRCLLLLCIDALERETDRYFINDHPWHGIDKLWGMEEPCEELGSHFLVWSAAEDHTSQYLYSLTVIFFLASKAWQMSTKENSRELGRTDSASFFFKR